MAEKVDHLSALSKSSMIHNLELRSLYSIMINSLYCANCGTVLFPRLSKTSIKVERGS